jgi:hypothetical protein
MLLTNMTGIRSGSTNPLGSTELSVSDIIDLRAEYPSLEALTVHGNGDGFNFNTKLAILREASENAQPKGEVTVQESPFTISPPSPSRSPF